MVINNESSDLAWLDSPVIRMGFQRSLSSTNSIQFQFHWERNYRVKSTWKTCSKSFDSLPSPFPPFPLLNNQKLERTNPLKESSRYNVVFFSFSLLLFFSLSVHCDNAIKHSRFFDFYFASKQCYRYLWAIFSRGKITTSRVFRFADKANEIFVLNCDNSFQQRRSVLGEKRKKERKDFIASTWKAGQRAANFSRRQISSIEFINFLTTYFLRPLHQRQTFAKDPGARSVANVPRYFPTFAIKRSILWNDEQGQYGSMWLPKWRIVHSRGSKHERKKERKKLESKTPRCSAKNYLRETPSIV